MTHSIHSAAMALTTVLPLWLFGLTLPTGGMLLARQPVRLAVNMQLPTFRLPGWFPTAATVGLKAPPAEAIKLRDLLVSGSKDSDSIDPLIDRLTTLRVPCVGLGAGLWRASYVRGQTPRWEKAARALPFLRSSNIAGQTYDQPAGTVQNYGEIFGPAVHFVAEGVFSDVDPSVRLCPKDYNVQVSRGGVVLGDRPFISSAISGPGFLRVLYVDADIRIFESPRDSPDKWEEAGLIVVQVRGGCFD